MGPKPVSYGDLLLLASNFPKVLGWAGSVVSALNRARKLDRQGIEKLLGGAEALVAFAEHREVSTEDLAVLARMLTNSLRERHGEYRVRGLLHLARECRTEGGGEVLPSLIGDGNLLEILIYLHKHGGMEGRAVFSQIAAHLRAEGSLPTINTHHF